MSEDRRSQTHTTGDVYVHPRGQKYRDEFDRIFGPREPNCCEEPCEGCKCLNTSKTRDSGKSSDA
jgi:hypothetical protein